MNPPIRDLTALSWCLDEIRESLSRAEGALESALRGDRSDGSHIRVARECLHRTQGALRFVSLDGAAGVIRAAETLIDSVHERQRTLDVGMFDVIARAIAATIEFLEGVIAGSGDVPLSLFPQYRELLECAGIHRADPVDLFDVPGLSQGVHTLDGRSAVCVPLAAAEADDVVARFERGLLDVMRDGDAQDAGAALLASVVRMQRVQGDPMDRCYWRLAAAFVDALRTGQVAADLHAKRQLGRIRSHLAQAVRADTAVTDRMLLELLFVLARSIRALPAVSSEATTSRSVLTDEVVRSFGLEGLVPAAWETPRYGLLDSRSLRQARESIASARASWERYVRGNAPDLAAFSAAVRQLDGALVSLPMPGMQRVVARLVGLRLLLDPGNQALAESLSLEIATTLLFLEQALEQGAAGLPGNDEHAAELAQRLEAVLRQPDAPAVPMPHWMESLWQAAQDRMVNVAYVDEMQANLRQCEQVLDTFFRDAAQRAPLPAVVARLHQVSGALRLLGRHDAAAGVHAVARQVAGFAAIAAVPPRSQCESIAQDLASLGFFIESLRRPGAGPAAWSPPGPRQADEVSDATADRARGAALDLPGASFGDSPSDASSAELLAVFLSEADELLDAIDARRIVLELSAGDVDALTTIRRAFHTLKGSSRMVGLWAFAEAAWALEQTINVWLASGRAVSTELLALIAEARSELLDWTRLLKADRGVQVDLADLIAQAARLRSQGEPASSLRGLPGTSPGWTAAVAAESRVGAAPPSEDTRQSGPEPLALDLADAIDLEVGTQTVRVGERELDASLYRIFLEEADHLLDVLDRTQARWSDLPAIQASADSIRAAHSLAGSAKVVGLVSVHEAAQSLESFLQAQSSSGLDVSSRDIEEFGLVLDRLRAALHRFAAGAEPQSDPSLDERSRALAARWGAVHAAERLQHEPRAEEAASSDRQTAAADSESQADEGAMDELADELDSEMLAAFLPEADEVLPVIGQALREWPAHPLDASDARVASVGRLLHTLKGSARMVGAMRLGQALHDMEAELLAVQGAVPPPPERMLALVARHDEIVAHCDALRTLSRDHASRLVRSAEVDGDTDPARTMGVTHVRVRAELLDRLVGEVGDVSVARTRIDEEISVVRQAVIELGDSVLRLRAQVKELAAPQASGAGAGNAARPAGAMTIDTRDERLQELVRVFGESVDDVATLHQAALRGLDDASRDLGLQARAVRTLQHDLMRIRMVRFGSITDRLFRVVRQAAKELGKRVHLEVQGGQVELDRGVLERLVGPLEHVLRNAVSHGIEPLSQRRGLGKPDAGAVTVSVRQEGETAVVSVADDGGGLNLEHIRARALSLHLIAPDSRPSDAELARCIFAPGFSTAAAVSELAGRGMGLDAVRAEVAAMGGRIEVDATAGQGTCFTAHLPLSLAASHVVLLSAGATRVAVPSGGVEQVLQVRPEALEQSIRNGALVDAQGDPVPLFRLSALLERPESPPVPQRFTPVAVLRSGADRIAVIVDRITASQEVVVKQVGPQLARLTGMAGATVLDNGDVVLILDLVQIAATGRVQPVGQDDPREGPTRAFARSPVVMVVDDSVTVRKVTERLLVRQGFSVMLARDGADALRQARETSPALMLLDIEMPRMDGFEVLARMQAEPALAAIPVVMISSRTSARHREQALAMGVEALLGKPWTETEMLELVHRLTAQALAR